MDNMLIFSRGFMFNNYFKKLLIVSFLSFLVINSQDVLDHNLYLDGKKSYQYLMNNGSFAMSIGTSVSQTHLSDNTVNPLFVRKKMLEIAQKMGEQEGRKWLTSEDRIWYLLHGMPTYACECGCKNIF